MLGFFFFFAISKINELVVRKQDLLFFLTTCLTNTTGNFSCFAETYWVVVVVVFILARSPLGSFPRTRIFGGVK